MLTITLYHKDGSRFGSLRVPAEAIVEASMIIYKGVHYAFNGMTGRFFSEVKFTECDPPVDITDLSL